MLIPKYFRIVVAVVLVAYPATLSSQSPEVSISSPPPPRVVGPILSPFHFEKRYIPPARLSNTARLESLIRGGNLYLSVRDVIALVLENNLDIAVHRYGPFLAKEVIRRAEGGGYLRQVDTALIAGPVSVSSLGLSTTSNGLAAGGGNSSGGSIISQIPPLPPNFDPQLTINTSFGHTTTPETNTLLNQTAALISDYRRYQIQYQQQFDTGTSVYATYFSYRQNLNSATPFLNPTTQGYIDLTITQNLLQGFGIAVNNRDIEVAKNNLKLSNLQFRRQIALTISAVLNLYWDLVSFNDDVRIKEQALATAEKLLEGNKKQVQIGTLPSIEVTRAAADVSASKEDLLIAQTNVLQQEIVLKNTLSRNGIASASLDEVHVVPLDPIEIPKTEDLKPVADLIETALANREDVQQSNAALDSSRILLKGSKNGLLPNLQAFAEFTNNGVTGPVNPLYNGSSGPPDPYLVGGYSNLLAQIFRRNFPNYSVGFSLNIPFRNRVAQADYVTDQLLLRQSELRNQQTLNQVRVDVKTSLIGLQQARSRYQTAVDTRELAEQSLKAEQNRFQYGLSTVALVIQSQKDLAVDQSLEVQAMANYTHAKIAFDQALGRTLDVNRISIDEAVSGYVPRQSLIPNSLPAEKHAGLVTEVVR
jgi:outer membrane protein